MKKKILIILVLFLSCLSFNSIKAEEQASISGSYTYDNKPFADTAVHLYKIAEIKDIDADEKFAYLDNYKELSQDINKIASNEWQKYANELKTYIENNHIMYDLEVITDVEGNYEFSGLDLGLYLLLIDDIDTNSAIYSSLPTLISVPNYDEINKVYTNEVIVKNKIEEQEKITEKPEPVPDVPQTSDDIMIYIILFLFAIVVLIGVGMYIYKTKKEIDKNEVKKN